MQRPAIPPLRWLVSPKTDLDIAFLCLGIIQLTFYIAIFADNMSASNSPQSSDDEAAVAVPVAKPVAAFLILSKIWDDQYCEM
jgi:hypothetical protein